MRLVARSLLLLGFLVLPTVAFAQATLAGVVRDPSGGVLPGVTVEAGSSALIEKVRTAVTDGSGQYRITDLAPGVYSVAYTLPGFAKVVREGLTLSGSGAVTIDIELRVGSVEETITVRAETPVVDVQTTRRETVLSNEVVRTMPATRSYTGVLANIPSLMPTGGVGAETNAGQINRFTAHGGRQNEGRITVNGLLVTEPGAGAGVSSLAYDVANVDEIQVLVSGGLGESETGGPIMNLVPRSGGNKFAGSAFYSGAGGWSRSNNVDDQLRSIGILEPSALINAFDANGSFGGPILRDRVWFFGAARTFGQSSAVSGAYANLYAGDATHWDYARDERVLTRNPSRYDIASIRLTEQVTPRNRVSFSQENQYRCQGSTLTENGKGCRTRGGDWIGVGSATNSPEAFPGYHDLPYYVTQATWSSPVSSRLLLDAGFSRFHYRFAGNGQVPPDGLTDLIPVTEQSTLYGLANFSYRGLYDPNAHAFADNKATSLQWRASAAYVTGAHNFKVGYLGSSLMQNSGRVANDSQLRYTFNNKSPISFGYVNAPRWDTTDRTMTTALFAQDQWTLGKLTLQGAVRYDRAWSWAPAEGNGATATSSFNPQPIAFERTVSVKGYNDITPRLGVAYDLFGNGKTALKANLGKYLQSAQVAGTYVANNPAQKIVTRVTARPWTDGNRNFQIDCNLSDPRLQDNLASGGDRCAALGGNDLNFGNANPGLTLIDPAILEGWGVRESDWQFGASVQQQVLPRVGVEVGYNRRWFQNFLVTDNLLVGPSDYDQWTLTAPMHPQLPNGGGYPITLYNITPVAFARGAQNFQTFETNFGPARTWYWHGVDFTANARLGGGLTVQGGTSTGRGVQNTCATVVKIDSPDPRGCAVTEPWITAIRGLTSYTVPKADVLVSVTFRSLRTTIPFLAATNSATNGASLTANYNLPNTVAQGLLGRLPSGTNANGTTAVNLVEPAQVYGDRVTQIDVRIAKVLRFGGKRADVGVDLYNLLNTNDAAGYEQTFDYATQGASWLRPTSIVAPRFARVHATLNF
ncbi:MAG: TonB-dependent receptor [Acidobacteriota bacterium]